VAVVVAKAAGIGYSGISGTAAYTLSLTSGFDADATAGNLVSFRLIAADSAVSYFFDSRSFGTTGFRPLLTVVAVPEPGSLALGLAALVVVAGRKVLTRTRRS
jgi:hypothetical protein